MKLSEPAAALVAIAPTSALALFVLAVGLAHSHRTPTATRCVAVEVTYGVIGRSVRVSLMPDGTWELPSPDDLARMANQNRDAFASCVATEALKDYDALTAWRPKRRASCPADPVATSDRAVAADPIMRKCRAFWPTAPNGAA